MYEYKCTLLRVIDGDTIDVLADLGFKVFKKIRVRLYGIDTPEIRTKDLKEKKKGFAAKARLEELLDDQVLTIKSVKICKFGRSVCKVFTSDRYGNKANVNTVLLKEGHAKKQYE